MTKNMERVPLLVGAGGGGLAHGPSVDDGSQHGNEPNKHHHNQTGDAFGETPAGTGLSNKNLLSLIKLYIAKEITLLITCNTLFYVF